MEQQSERAGLIRSSQLFITGPCTITGGGNDKSVRISDLCSVVFIANEFWTVALWRFRRYDSTLWLLVRSITVQYVSFPVPFEAFVLKCSLTDAGGHRNISL